MIELKDILKGLRDQKQVSMDKMCEDLKNIYNVAMAKSTISKWENGKAEPSLANARILTKYFNVTLDYLLGLEKEELYNFNKFSKEETTLLESFNKLDTDDKNKVIDYTQLLSNQDKYKTITDTTDEITATTEEEFTIAKKKALEARRKAEQYFKENPHLMPVASHDKEGNFTDEDYKHDDDIMNNDDLWND